MLKHMVIFFPTRDLCHILICSLFTILSYPQEKIVVKIRFPLNVSIALTQYPLLLCQ